MHRFGPDSVTDFLRAVDHHLRAPTSVVVIGGSAIGLAYEQLHATPDLDLLRTTQEFRTACVRAREETGLDVPVQEVGVYFAPESYEDRLQPVVISGLQNLRVYCPERHDLALMKLARGTEHDLQGIEDIHRASPLELETLLSRFHETYVTGRREDFQLSLLLLVERLFGKAAADALEERL